MNWLPKKKPAQASSAGIDLTGFKTSPRRGHHVKAIWHIEIAAWSDGQTTICADATDGETMDSLAAALNEAARIAADHTKTKRPRGKPS